MTRRLLFGSIAVAGSLAVALVQAPHLVAGSRTSPSTTAVPETAAVVAGTAISTKQVDEKLGARLIQLRTQEYRMRKTALDEMITTMLIEKEAAARGISTEELLAAEVDAKAKAVTEEEARAVLESARDRMPPMPDSAAIESITKGMQRQRASQRRTEYAAELRRKHGVQLLIEPPRFQIAKTTGPSLGPSDAPVTVVEFSDFQCPYCARSAETVRQLVDKYRGKIRLVFQDFPLPNHKEAPKAAEAAACAHDQGKFWEMHDRLFQNQDKLAIADLKRHAVDLGLERGAFDACLDGGKHAAAWQQGRTVAESYGITGTPAFFVNGIPVFGAAPMQEFTQIIDDELARAEPPDKTRQAATVKSR